MSNPVMSKNPYFQNTGVRPNQFPQGQQGAGAGTQYGTDYTSQYSPTNYQQYTQWQAQQQAYNQQAQQQAFDRAGYGSAGAFNGATTDKMTYRDAMNKTAILLAAAVLSGVLTTMFVPLNLLMPAAIVATIGAFVVGMIIAFKRMVSPALALGYSVLEGVALGALTMAFNLIYPGVAMQAILATTIIVAVTLALHYSGKVRTSAKGMKYAMIVALGGILFGVVNIFISAFTGNSLYFSMPTIGIGVGVIMILVAAYMLINDFEQVQYAEANGAPKEFAWTCGIGIVMTILWIYVEVLRIAAIIAENR